VRTMSNDFRPRIPRVAQGKVEDAIQDSISRPSADRSLFAKLKLSLDEVARSRTPIGGLSVALKAKAKAPYRQWRLYLADIFLAGLALLVAGIFRFGVNASFLPAFNHSNIMMAVPLFMFICAVVFPLTGLYTRNWRYVSIGDLRVVVWAVMLSSIMFVSVMFIFTRLAMIPRSVIAIEFFILVPLMTAARLKSRLWELSPSAGVIFGQPGRDMVPVLLVGAGSDADSYLRALQSDSSSRYQPVGLLDDSKDHQEMLIRGVPVLGTLSDFEKVMTELRQRNRSPRHVIFAKPLSKFPSDMVESIVASADKLGIAISRLPSPTELRHTRNLDQFEVRPIELTDLLERPQKALDRVSVAKLISGRRVLVTGAGGSIGSELCLQIAALKPAELVLIESTEYNLYAIDLELAEKFPRTPRRLYLCNIREEARVDEIFGSTKPELVFHAAALKHVPMVELNPSEGLLTNAIGTKNIADAARRHGVLAMVQVSTDKVVNPTSMMGLTKRLAELYCQALDLDSGGKSRFMTVRFGNVLGSSGSLIPLFQRQIAKGGPLTVTDPNMTRYFMTIREAVELTLQASAHGLQQRLGYGEIFVLDMGAPVKIIDVARRMIRLAGYKPEDDIKIEIIGCRPGEKLYEELFDEQEKRVESPVPGVFGAVPVPVALDKLQAAFKEIKSACEECDLDRAFEVVSGIAPTYVRQRAPSPPRSLPTAS